MPWALCALGYTQTMVRAAQRVVFDIRRDLFAHLQTLPLSFFDRTRTGDVMSYFTNDVDTVSEALNNSFANVIQAAIQAVGTIVLLFVLDRRLTLVTVACDVALIAYVRVAGKGAPVTSRRCSPRWARHGSSEEMCAGQKVVQAYTHERESLAGFRARATSVCASRARRPRPTRPPWRPSPWP